MTKHQRRVHSAWIIAAISMLVIIVDIAIGLAHHQKSDFLNVKSRTSSSVSPAGQRVRTLFAEQIKKTVPEPEATLGTGFLIGDKGNLPPELTNELRLLGLAHIIVASGYNLTILVRIARRLFSRFSKYLAALASVTTIIGFIAITGASPSMVRAGIVTSLSLLAWYYGRKIHPLVILPLAAAITILIKPAYGWGDVGWELSFAAFAGIMVLAPLIQNYFWGKQKPGVIRQIFIETLSAQLATFPIIAFVFGQYSPLSLVSNMLVLPLVPIAMLLTFAAAIGGWLHLNFLGLPAYAVLKYMIEVTGKLAGLPAAEGSIDLSIAGLVGSYVVLTAICVYFWRRTKHDFQADNSVV